MELDWLVIYTKPQQERKVSQNLQKSEQNPIVPQLKKFDNGQTGRK